MGRVLALGLIAALAACSSRGSAPPPPPAKQPSVVDRAVAPVVQDLGGRIGPQGGIVFQEKPPKP